MSKAFPIPWTFEAENACEDSPIKAANGEYVLVRDDGVYPPDLETCHEIVTAVNERDYLRELVKRMADYMETYHALGVQGKSLVTEARCAIKENAVQ